MLLTILLSIMMMIGLFLLLLGGVGFVQDKKFFSSAPRQIPAECTILPGIEHGFGTGKGMEAEGWIDKAIVVREQQMK